MRICPICQASIPPGTRICPRCGASEREDLLASAASDPTGLLERLRRACEGEFTIIRELGRGGMGRVILAREVALDRRVAIKVLPPDLAQLPEIAQRFRREARTAAKLNHPHIMSVFQVLERDGLHFFTMPFVSGPSLRQILRRTPRLEGERCRRYLYEAADALSHAHAQGVIHRDIKPENMLLEGGPDGRLLLTDFGIAKALGSATTTLTRPGAMMGTPYYMAPEVCGESRSADTRSDQYSLGLVAYEMLAGRFPLSADSLAGIVYKHLHEYPEPLANTRPDVPASLRGVIERAIRKDPDERFPDMRELRDALRPAAARTRIGSRVWGARSGAAAAASFALAVIGGSLLHGWHAGRGRPGRVADGPAVQAASSPRSPEAAGGQPAPVDTPLSAAEASAETEDAGVRGVERGAAKLAAPIPAGRRIAEAAPDESERVVPDGEPAAADSPPPPAQMDLGDADSETAGVSGEPGARPDSATASGIVSARDPAALIEGLLREYRQAVEAEDLERLAAEVYGGPIPAQDEKLLRLWFDAGEAFTVDLAREELAVAGDSAVAGVRQRMSFRLESTGEARDHTIRLLFHFRAGRGGWWLTRFEPRR